MNKKRIKTIAQRGRNDSNVCNSGEGGFREKSINAWENSFLGDVRRNDKLADNVGDLI